jgi:hypothetical protein
MLNIARWLVAVLLGASFIAAPAQSSAQVYFGISFGSSDYGGQVFANFAPPELPQYDQPPCPGANFIWMPGYWAWGPYGYYWVPGTWVLAPEVGFYWTPGYWGWDNDYDAYVWNPGYWAPQVGFYGGIDYGYGYYGDGYVGGQWNGDGFAYNTAVTNVNITIVHNVYVNRTVVINNYERPYHRISFNGGSDGIQARPTVRQLAVLNNRRFPMTSAQTEHVRLAQQDRNLLASVNHGTPYILTVRRPFNADRRPVGFSPVRQEDRVVQPQIDRMPQQQAPQYRAPRQQAPQYRMPQQQAPQYRMPQPQIYRAPQYRMPQQQAPQYRAPQQQAPQYRMPQQQAPQYRTPQQQAPQYRTPQQQAPQYRAPQQQAPQYRMPQQQAPQYRMPQQQAPQYRMPQQQAPQYRMPQQQAPQYRMPQQNYRAPRPGRTPPG